MSGIEPGSPITTATLTYLAHVQLQLKISSIVLWIARRSDGCWTLSYITKVDFTDNIIHQSQNHSHSEYFFNNKGGSNIYPILTL